MTPGKGHQRSPPAENCRDTGSTSFPVVGKRAQLLHLCSGSAAVIVPRGANMYTVFDTWGLCIYRNRHLRHCGVWCHRHFAFCHLSLHHLSALQASPVHFSPGLWGSSNMAGAALVVSEVTGQLSLESELELKLMSICVFLYFVNSGGRIFSFMGCIQTITSYPECALFLFIKHIHSFPDPS